jgi:hypothetical protein
MRMYRVLAIAVVTLLQATIGCHKRIISVSPFAYPYASPGDYLEFRKATPDIADFVVVFDGQSPCGAVTMISVNGTKPGGCKVVTPSGGSVTYSSSYEIFLNSSDRSTKPAIARPSSWPIDIPFNVVPCRVCGSAVNVQGSPSNAQGASSTDGGKSTSQSKVSDPPTSTGAISCPSGAASVTPIAVSISTNPVALWKENGPNLGWAIIKFYPSSPCKGTNPTSSNPVCDVSNSPSSGSYTYDIAVTSCTSQPKGSGQLTVTP